MGVRRPHKGLIYLRAQIQRHALSACKPRYAQAPQKSKHKIEKVKEVEDIQMIYKYNGFSLGIGERSTQHECSHTDWVGIL